MSSTRHNLQRFCSLAFVLFSQASFAATATSVSQFGITWTFDKAYEAGQFCNGDWWVKGPVTIVQITPASTDISGRAMHGSMPNPTPLNESLQGYDSIMHHYGSISSDTYRASLNAARPNGLDLSAGNPLVVPPHSSLVSTISFAESNRPQTKSAAVLTVLAEIPPAGSFRPPYAGTDKTIHFNKSDLDYAVLSRLAAVAGAPSFATAERNFERPWIDHIPDFYARYQHPADNMPDYSRDFSKQIGEAALLLNLNYADAEKEKLLIGLAQLGIDNYRNIQLGASLSHGNWPPREGQNMGRKLPIVLAGRALGGTLDGDDEASDMLMVGTWWTTGAVFQEDLNMFYVAQEDVGRLVQGVNKGGLGSAVSYSQDMVGLPEWGSRHYGPDADITRDDADWETANYRGIDICGMAGVTMVIHIMGLQSAWDRQARLDYMDRWFYRTDPPGEDIQSQAVGTFAKNMWLAYRQNYPPVWPDTTTVIRQVRPLPAVRASGTGIKYLYDNTGRLVKRLDAEAVASIPGGIYFIVTNPGAQCIIEKTIILK